MALLLTLRSISALLIIGAQLALASDEEHLLYNHLLSNYDKLERPVANISQPVTVKLSVILQQIIDLNEKDQVITINAWLKYTWNDYRLRWEPKEYGNIGDVRFPMEKLWKPDVLLYNSVDSSFDSTYPTKFVVYYDGTINWIPPGIFLISCKIDITWYPFDEQNCFLKFGSWTYDGTKIDLRADESAGNGFDMSEYMINGEFHLYNTTVIRSEKFYDCCPEPYPDLKFYLNIKRRTLFHANNFVIPCILITVMTILGFLLPPDAGEKISLQITVLLAVSVLLTIVSAILPPTSEACPLLGVFFSVCMVFCSFSLLSTVYVLNLHHSTPDMNEMGPFTTEILLNWLPWLLLMGRPGREIKRQNLRNPLAALDEAERLRHETEQKSEADLEARVNRCCKLLAERGDSLGTWTQAMLMIIHRCFIEMKFINKRMEDEDKCGDMENDWKFAAAVVDRLSLWLFTFFVTFFTCFIFFRAPYLSAE